MSTTTWAKDWEWGELAYEIEQSTSGANLDQEGARLVSQLKMFELDLGEAGLIALAALERLGTGCRLCGNMGSANFIWAGRERTFQLCMHCEGRVARALSGRVLLEEIRQRQDDLSLLRSGPLLGVDGPACGVYVVSHDIPGGLTKVGIATDVAKRVKGIASACGFPVVLARSWTLPNQEMARATEGLAHRWLSRHRGPGEWFSITTHSAVRAVEAAMACVGGEVERQGLA